MVGYAMCIWCYYCCIINIGNRGLLYIKSCQILMWYLGRRRFHTSRWWIWWMDTGRYYIIYVNAKAWPLLAIKLPMFPPDCWNMQVC